MSNQPTLYTERLTLRPLEPGDAPVIRQLAGDRRIAVNTFMPHPYEEGMAESFINSTHEGWEEGNLAVFAITLKSDRSLVGTVGLKEIDRDHRRAEMGYWIAVERWGNGYATESAKALLAFAFDTLELNRIYAGHFDGNPASGRVLQKIGMRREGVQRQHIVRFDTFKDHILYGIIREEWEAMRPEKR